MSEDALARRISEGIAHDLNNCLSPAKGYAALLAESFPEGSEERRRALKVAQSVDRASDYVWELMLISGHVEASLALVDLATVLGDAVGLGNCRDVRASIDPGIASVRADGKLLTRSIANLIQNACHASGGGCGNVVVEIYPDGAGKNLHISVEDNGSGMAPEAQRQALAPYFSQWPEGGRRGIGLAVVDAVARLHHGGVHIQSRPGEGARVEMVIPLVP